MQGLLEGQGTLRPQGGLIFLGTGLQQDPRAVRVRNSSNPLSGSGLKSRIPESVVG